MKRAIALILLSVAFFVPGVAQQKPVKIVFDCTSSDTLTHQAAMRHLSMMASAYPESRFELVLYGASMPMVLTGKSTVSKSIGQLVKSKNVEIKICQYTLERNKVDKSQLLPGVATVPDGIMEIVTKQGEGWAYIKEAHH
jgi:intracellular sulfur oxidation DsrE/DsrF family protein